MTIAKLTNPYFTFPAPLQELPTRPLSDPGGPTFIVRATLISSDAQGVTLSGTTQTDEALTVTGDVVFEPEVTIRGSVAITNPHPAAAVIRSGTLIERDLVF